MKSKTTRKLEEVYVGELRLDGKVDITDPSYDRDVWCWTTTKCQPGVYKGYAYISDEGAWGKRVAQLSIFKDNKKEDLDKMKLIGSIGVDAGMAGFFRDKPDFPDDAWYQFLVDSGVFKTRDDFDYSRKTYAINYGIFSESGFGDGEYDVYANEDRSAFTIVFIPEEEEDYEEEEDDEE